MLKELIKMSSKFHTKAHVKTSADGWYDARAWIFISAFCEIAFIAQVIHARLEIKIFDLQGR